MSSEPGKSERETWRDWLPEGYVQIFGEPRLITRDELLGELYAVGREVNDRTLRHWEHEGIFPRPVRKHHKGKAAALYPAWHPTFIAQTLKDRGDTSASMTALRASARDRYRRASITLATGNNTYRPPRLPLVLPASLATALEALATEINYTGEPGVVRIELRLVDAGGKDMRTYVYHVGGIGSRQDEPR